MASFGSSGCWTTHKCCWSGVLFWTWRNFAVQFCRSSRSRNTRWRVESVHGCRGDLDIEELLAILSWSFCKAGTGDSWTFGRLCCALLKLPILFAALAWRAACNFVWWLDWNGMHILASRFPPTLSLLHFSYLPHSRKWMLLGTECILPECV